MALGICSFALVAILGLFTTGLQTNKTSEEQIQAANLVSMLVSTRRASPTNSLGSFAIPSRAMTNFFTNAYNNGGTLTNYVGFDGQIVTSANAEFLISCQAGTNMLTGPDVAQVYVMLSWPAWANPSNPSVGHYEYVTYIPLR